MLNKLLKRCMPWMDKGRWYQIKFGGSSPETIEFKFDRIFSDASFLGIDGGGVKIAANFARNTNDYQVIDVKFIGEPGYYTVGTTVTAARSTTNNLEIVCPGPGTIWIFIASIRAGD